MNEDFNLVVLEDWGGYSKHANERMFVVDGCVLGVSAVMRKSLPSIIYYLDATVRLEPCRRPHLIQ